MANIDLFNHGNYKPFYSLRGIVDVNHSKNNVVLCGIITDIIFKVMVIINHTIFCEIFPNRHLTLFDGVKWLSLCKYYFIVLVKKIGLPL